MNHIKSIITLIIAIFFVQQKAFTQKTEQKISLNKMLKKSISNYQKFCSFTESFDSLSENYIIKFKSLFTSDAKIFNDIAKDSMIHEKLKVEKYIDIVKDHYPIGFEVDTVLFDFFTIEKNESKNKKEKKDYPYILRARVRKSFYGYYDDSIYFERKPESVFMYLVNKDFNITKIFNIDFSVNQRIKWNNDSVKLFEKTKNNNNIPIIDFDKKIDSLNNEIKKLQSEVIKIKKEKENSASKVTNKKILEVKRRNEELKKLRTKETELKNQYKKEYSDLK